MAIDINAIIIVGTLFVIFGIFLLFDLFKRNEKYAYLAYLVAVIPASTIWGLGYDPVLAFLILVILWDITLLRDTIGVYLKKEKDINEILLYLTLSILILLIISAILPVVNVSLQNYLERMAFFWLPNIHSEVVNFNPSIVLGFKISATLLILLIIIPLIIDIKDEDVPLPVFIIYIGIFIIPFLYISYIWLPEAMGVLTFLFSVVLFFVLLLITRSGKEAK
ncbi:hypothetical protein LCGC14_1906000 [marine sediment metagenome]|uniref:Uncharacterized protein n=1 Tax=marine sediment metagenome TaxID=412755 RepID=A0A0F9ITB2_9ZZZZ